MEANEEMSLQEYAQMCYDVGMRVNIMDDDPPTSVAGSDTEEETQAPPVMNEPAKANIVDDDSPTSIVPSDSMEEDDDPPTALALSDTEDANNLSVPFEQPCRQTEKSSTGAEVCTDTV
ncbi:unnamed protein product, partial [Durusdinium trenchii]